MHWLWRDVRLLFRRAIKEYVDDRCTQVAAGISYYVFFSIFPLAIFLVTVFGQIMRDERVKQRVINALLDTIPLAPAQGRQELEQALEGVSTDVSLLGLLSIVGLIWAASAMMTAFRNALNIAWDTDYRRPALQGKLLDIFMIFVVGILVALSIAATAIRPYVAASVDAVAVEIGPAGALLLAGLWLLTVLVPIIVSFFIFSSLYRFVPAVKTTFTEVWPGALTAAIGFEIAKTGFTIYLQNFANYNEIYGSLGAVVVFMLFIFIAANVMLLGAEVASEWPRVRAGHYDAVISHQLDEEIEEQPLHEQLGEILRQSLFGPEGAPEHVDEEEIQERERQQAEARAREIARLREAESADEASESQADRQ